MADFPNTQEVTAKPGKTDDKKAKAKTKIEAELDKIKVVMGVSTNFGNVTTYADFLKEAEAMYKGYDLPFDAKNFKLIKKAESENGASKKAK